MKRALRGAVLSGAILLAFQSAVAAQGTKEWFVCGGDLFYTCAAVHLGVGPADAAGISSVQLKIWNLSGAFDSWGASVFTKIGFFNAGGASAVTNSLAMSGPVRVREVKGTLVEDTPEQWVLKNPNNAGGVFLDLTASNGNGVDNALANACEPEGPGGQNQLWENPCWEGAPEAPTLADVGWVNLDFQSTGTWDLESTELLIMAQSGPGGLSTQCITGQNCFLLPEPSTVALLATGLLGLAGVAIVRRRRDQEEDFGTTAS